MTYFFQLLLAAAGVGLLLSGGALASAAPLLLLGGAFVVWLMVDEPPRLTAWGALAAGVAVCVLKGLPFLVPALMGAALLFAVEWFARAQNRDVPAPLSIVLALLISAGGSYWLTTGSSAGGGALSSTPTRIVLIGDSLTSGVPGDGQPLWGTLLEQKLGSSVVNLSYPGDTLSASLQRWQGRLATGRWNSANPTWNPELVVVMLGGNDIKRRGDRASLVRDLRQWAEALRAAQVPVMLISVPGGMIGDPFSGAWREVAKEFDFLWMDESMLRTVFTTPSMTTDGIHLNAQGAEFVAETVSAQLRK